MAPVVDTLRLTAEAAMGLVERGELSPAELHAAYLGAIELAVRWKSAGTGKQPRSATPAS